MGLAEEAEALLQVALSRSDESVEADRAAVALLRGEIGVARGDAQGALDDLETAYALRENAYHLESLAHGLYRAGNLEAAREQVSHPAGRA